MMKCEDRFEMLFRYSQGDLDARDVSEIEKHLGECTACRKRLDTLQGVESCVRESLALRPPSPDISGSVMKALSREDKAKMRGWAWVWAGATACLAAGVILGGLLGPRVIPNKPTVIVAVKPSNSRQANPSSSKSKTDADLPTKTRPMVVAALPCGCPRTESACKGCKTDARPTVRASRHRRTMVEQPASPPATTPTNVASAGPGISAIEPKGLNDARLIITPDMEKRTTP